MVRAAGGNNFTIVGDSAFASPAPNQLSIFATRIPVQAGDFIGLYQTSGDCARFSGAYFYSAINGVDPPSGSTVAVNGPFSGIQLDIAASLEPDADGFGDETQDPSVDPNGCTPAPGDTSAPETEITKRPKHKTRKKAATFEFTASEPGSTFECKLDGGSFQPCTSPRTVKVKKGKHNFQVRAIDAAGNVDSAPATADWKVKKKRK